MMNVKLTTTDRSAGTYRLPQTETPKSLVSRSDLSKREKIEILHQWELDLRERMVAEDENMPATEPSNITLDQVLRALDQLGAHAEEHPVPTAHG